jgi:HTH-type transcriptional regulator / antitoxin HigA
METLKYKIIKSKKQYFQYCNMLETLCDAAKKNKSLQDEIDMLTLLIEKYDNENLISKMPEPIKLLKTLMEEHQLKAVNLAEILDISKGLVSDILNYKKGLSKEIIRKLAEHFKLRQEAFNRPYKLISPINTYLRNASVMNTEKNLVEV